MYYFFCFSFFFQADHKHLNPYLQKKAKQEKAEKKEKKAKEERVEKKKKEAEIAPGRQRFDALFAGLEVSGRTLDLLRQHEVTSPSALQVATVDDLKQLGVSAGQALIIKSKYNLLPPAPNPSEAAAVKTKSSANQIPSAILELDALLQGLKITQKTRDILLSHQLATATALSVATLETLTQIGLTLDQAHEIKSRFNTSTDGAAAATVVVPAARPLTAPSQVMPERLLDTAAESPISAKLSPIFGLLDLHLRPLRDTVDPFSSAGVSSVARAVDLALYRTADQVRLCACGIIVSYYRFISFLVYHCIHMSLFVRFRIPWTIRIV